MSVQFLGITMDDLFIKIKAKTSQLCIEQDYQNDVFIRGGLVSGNGKCPIGTSVHKKVPPKLKDNSCTSI